MAPFPSSSSVSCSIATFLAAAVVQLLLNAHHAQASSVRMVSWNLASVRDNSFVMDRVAILTRERERADQAWCMGLLVAPDALLTYAHCVADMTKNGKQPGVSWAFFGNTMEDFGGREPREEQGEQESDPNTMKRETAMPAAAGSGSYATTAAGSVGDSSSLSASSLADNSTQQNGTATTARSRRRWLRDEDVEAGDVDNWVQVAEIILHPSFDASASSSASPATNMAIVRLAAPREIEPFQLLPDEAAMANLTNVEITNAFDAYRVSNQFIVNAKALKAEGIGPFRRVSWYYCALGKVNGVTLSVKKFANQMCVIPEAMRKRVPLNTINSFVMIGTQLAGLSFCHSKDCKASVVHPYVLVSGIKDFIEQATRRQDKWTDMGLFTIGGTDAVLQGYLSGLRKTKEASNFCLGSLIAPQFVLTAAHCVKDVAFSFVSVGSKYASATVDGEQIRVKSVKIHPEFNAKSLLNDFALVELQYMSIQSPLVLDNESNQDLYSTTSRLTLYGFAEAKQSVQALSLPLVQNSVCNGIIGDSTMDVAIVCAGGEEGKDGCQGDSGAPLVQEPGGGGEQFLVAQSSFGWGCGIKGVPAVYAKVSAAASFIEDNVMGHTWRYRFLGGTSGGGGGGGSIVPGGTTTGNDAGQGSSQKPGTPSTMSPSEEERSGEGATSGDQQQQQQQQSGPRNDPDALIDSICKNENWTHAKAISLLGSLQSIVIPVTTSQFTRDTVATTLLVSKEHVQNEEIEVTSSSSASSNSGSASPSSLASREYERAAKALAATSRYSCSGSIQMYSSGDLSGVEKKLADFETRPLRKRKARFSRTPDMVRLPVDAS